MMAQHTDDTTRQDDADDQELTRVLAGVTSSDNKSLDYEEVDSPKATKEEPAARPKEEVAATPAPVSAAAAGLDDIKVSVVNDLRPLVDKLNVPSDEKFDTYLLLIRTTDDTTLIPPAYAAAKQIEDESRRAQALLDIIKEIDFLSSNKS